MRGRVINIMSQTEGEERKEEETQNQDQKRKQTQKQKQKQKQKPEQQQEQKQRQKQEQEQPPSPSVFWKSPFRELIFGTGLEAGRQTNNPPSISGDPALWNEVQSKPRWGPAGDEGVKEDEERGRNGRRRKTSEGRI